MSATPPRIVVGISGASGIVYGIRTLEALRELGVETHLVMSKAARMTLAYETDLSVRDVEALADHTYGPDNVGAAVASGSFRTLGMVVVPCSMRSLAEIAHGTTSSLLTRAADVALKERRTLVLSPRESPLTLQHIENMASVTRMGGIVCPAAPAFYTRPSGLEDVIDHSVGRMLDLFGLDSPLVQRWDGTPS